MGDSSSQGCSDFIANASRALQLEKLQLRRLGPKASLRSTGAVARGPNCVGDSALLAAARADGCNVFKQALGHS